MSVGDYLTLPLGREQPFAYNRGASHSQPTSAEVWSMTMCEAY